MSWDFSTDPEFEERLDWIRRFVDDKVLPLEVLDVDDDVLVAICRDLSVEVKEEGLWATHLPPELGGQGFGQVKLALIHEILGRTRLAPVVFGNHAPDSGNAELLALAGTEVQKERWLYPLLDGRLRSAFSMTEPEHAGSDPTVMSTRARSDGDDWIIDGHKWFTSHGSIADFLIVMVVTDPEAPRHERASMIIVPTDTPGVEVARDVATMAGDEPLGFGHAEIHYRDCRVPYTNLLGERGRGFALAQARLGPGRIHHCMRWLGQAARAFDALCERSLQREVRGGVLADQQTVQNWIADSAAEMQAARLMTLHAAWTIDQFGARAAKRDISLIKFFGAKVLHDVIDRALQAHGALGYSKDMPLERMYRVARSARFVDGVDEVHRISVARGILKEYPEPAGTWPSEHVPTRRAAAREQYARYLDDAVVGAG